MSTHTQNRTLTVRLDTDTWAMLDALVAFYGRQAVDLGLTADRSSTVRVLIRAAHRDMRDKLERRGRPTGTERGLTHE
jgi:hypothetical protein